MNLYTYDITFYVNINADENYTLGVQFEFIIQLHVGTNIILSVRSGPKTVYISGARIIHKCNNQYHDYLK